MPTIQYSAGRGPLSVHNLFTFCIRRCVVLRACKWVISALFAVLLIFSFRNLLMNFCVVGKGPAPYGKIFKILFIKFSPLHRSTLLCSNVVKFCRRKISEIVRYLPDQKNSAASKTVTTVQIAPKMCQGQPPTMYSECSRLIQIGSLSAELQRRSCKQQNAWTLPNCSVE